LVAGRPVVAAGRVFVTDFERPAGTKGNVFRPSVTFNKVNTYPWFKERVYKLEDDGSYDPTDRTAAIEKALEFTPKIPIGLLYRTERPTYEDSEPVLLKGPLVDQSLGLDRRTLVANHAETM
jgi:hypothetical protein